jgi:hypothetical protein
MASIGISSDSRERRRLLALLVVGSIVVVWIVGWLTPAVRHEATLAIAEGRLRSSAVCQAVLIGLGLFSCGIAAFGVHAHRFGRSVLAAGRFPPPGVEASRVLTGRSAVLLGRAQSALGASLVVLAGILFCLVLYGLGRLSFFG